MRNQRTARGTILISVLFTFSLILSSCATHTPIIPGEFVSLEPQTLVEVPGGLMLLPDGVGTEHPALVYDFQIQSRLVVGAEYEKCVEAGACEPAAGMDYPLAPAGVNWYQAQAYCSYLGGRLPTEAELFRASGGGEDCQETGGGLISQEGFGEWVYDWDDPDYYNRSLTSNPFGPIYGDLKVAMGLDLEAASLAMGKWWIKLDEFKSREIKLDEIKLEEIKLEEIKLDEIKLDEIKLDELKLEVFKFFSEGEWKVSSDGWDYSIKFEFGKFYIDKSSSGHDKWEPTEGDLYPRMGILPDQANPLVGFRCVTEGASLSYAPICKTETVPNCSLPAVQMETISAQLDEADGIDPNFKIAGANCPQGGMFDLTISHQLPSGEGVGVKADGEECTCQEYEDYPGNLYCSCPSPGVGTRAEIEACASDQETLILMDEFCPDGYRYDLREGGCTQKGVGVPLIYSLVDDEAEQSACPAGPGLPVPTSGILGMGLASVEGIGEVKVPADVDQWELFSLSDGSGMCPPGYGFNQETGCCTPLSTENYDCEPGEYFDAGLKQCLPVGWDGCGPCQELGPEGVCVPSENEKFLSYRCNSDDASEGIDYDEYGRPQESTGGCASGAYKDPGIGLCLETRDGCARGYYLDPVTETCRPLSGPESPCPSDSTYNPQTGCCVPSPGTGESECPEGTEYDGAGCTSLVSGCPPTHYYDEETDSCLLREPGDCPGGTSLSLIRKCIPDEPGVCPEDFAYDPETDSCYKGDFDQQACVGGKTFDPALGYCKPAPSEGMETGQTGGRCDIEDLEVTKLVDPSTPDLLQSCFDPESALMPIRSTIQSPDGIFHCLILSADKTFRSGWGFCRPDPAGDGDTEQYFTVMIQEGRIASITRVSPDPIDPAEAGSPPGDPTECGMQFVFGEKYYPESDDDEDDWSGDPVSGALPAGATCQLNIYIDAGWLFNLNNCSIMDLYVPACVIGPTPTPTPTPPPDKCAGLEFGTCQNTVGCGWSPNQNKCVVDNCTGVGDEKSCELIAGCIWQAGICQID